MSGALLQPYLEKRPRLLGTAWGHATAVVIGDVELGDQVSLWPHAVLRGDYNAIRIGRGTNIQDGAVVHNDHGNPCLIGADCVVGHQACVHGSTVGDGCLIGIGAILLNGSKIGDGCIIGAGALVGEGKEIPARSLVLGMPGKVVRQVTEEELQRTLKSAADYRGYALRQLPGIQA